MSLGPFQIIIVMIVLAASMVPAIVAFTQDHPKKVLILILNILLGWTLIAWIVLFVWALRPQEVSNG